MGKAEDRRYQTLVRVLDSICQEAPAAAATYRESSNDGRIAARSRAFIHLYLKARFGMTEFTDRESLITDGPGDGGIDAYFIDRDQRRVFLLQSKFRATAQNFSAKNMSAEDIMKMDVRRILEGESRTEAGAAYCEKIRKFQSVLRKTSGSGSFKPFVTILGNAKSFSTSQLQRLVGDFPVEQYDHLRSYKELLFPVVNGSYFSDPDLVIEIQRRGRKSDSHLDYDVVISGVSVNVKLLYVPTQEIARVMHTYKNSILLYNPRSYLEVAKNAVNREIIQSLRADTTNEFALFNNGVTIVSDETSLSTNTGKKGLTQLSIRAPQLINGAQTAYSLSRFYSTENLSYFRNKEVLLRVITFRQSKNAGAVPRDRLIARISRASNLQTRVDEADRRSNDPLQLQLQAEFFERYGLFYERKRGEFVEGLADGYIDKSLIVNRERLLRVALACDGNVSQARSSVAKYFRKSEFEKIMKVDNVGRYAFGYEALQALRSTQARSRDGDIKYRVAEFGQALRYGTYAVVGVCISRFAPRTGEDVYPAVDSVLQRWRRFERWAERLASNKQYQKEGVLDAVNYYKGQTLNDDLRRYDFKLPNRRR